MPPPAPPEPVAALPVGLPAAPLVVHPAHAAVHAHVHAHAHPVRKVDVDSDLDALAWAAPLPRPTPDPPDEAGRGGLWRLHGEEGIPRSGEEVGTSGGVWAERRKGDRVLTATVTYVGALGPVPLGLSRDVSRTLPPGVYLAGVPLEGYAREASLSP